MYKRFTDSATQNKENIVPANSDQAQAQTMLYKQYVNLAMNNKENVAPPTCTEEVSYKKIGFTLRPDRKLRSRENEEQPQTFTLEDLEIVNKSVVHDPAIGKESMLYNMVKPKTLNFTINVLEPEIEQDLFDEIATRANTPKGSIVENARRNVCFRPSTTQLAPTKASCYSVKSLK